MESDEDESEREEETVEVNVDQVAEGEDKTPEVNEEHSDEKSGTEEGVRIQEGKLKSKRR